MIPLADENIEESKIKLHSKFFNDLNLSEKGYIEQINYPNIYRPVPIISPWFNYIPIMINYSFRDHIFLLSILFSSILWILFVFVLFLLYLLVFYVHWSVNETSCYCVSKWWFHIIWINASKQCIEWKPLHLSNAFFMSLSEPNWTQLLS